MGTTYSGGVLSVTDKKNTSLRVDQIIPSKSDNLVGYWRMDGNWNDSAGGNDGVANADATFVSTSVVGTNSGFFGGIGDSVDIGDPDSLKISGNITVSAWLKFSEDLNNRPIVSRWGSAESYLLSVDFIDSNKIIFCIRVSNVNKCATSSNTYNDGQWHLATGVFDGANVRLYIDGGGEAVTGEATAGPIDTPATNVRISGYNSNANSFFDGEVDEVSIWDEALTANEIKLLYENPLHINSLNSSWTPHFSSLAGYWKMDGNWNDSSGNENHGTVGGDSAFSSTAKVGNRSGIFDGTADIMYAADDPSFDATSFTFISWFKAESTSVNARLPFYKTNTAGNYNHYSQLYINIYQSSISSFHL